MTTSLTTMREKVAKEIGAYISGTTTANGNTDGTSLVCSDLMEYADDHLKGKYITVPTDSSFETRKIKNSKKVSGTVIFEVPFTSQVTSSTAFKIYDLNPTDIDSEINQAIKDAYPDLCQIINDVTIITEERQNKYTLPSTVEDVRQVFLESFIGVEENLLTNGDLEAWTGSAPDDWDSPTNITTAKEDDFVLRGSHACKCTSTSSAGSIYYSVSDHGDYSGQRLSLKIHVYSNTADRIKASIYESSDNESSYHQGRGWEWLEVSFNMPTAPSALWAGITVAEGDAIDFYFDEAILTQSYRAVSQRGTKLLNWDTINGVLIFPYQPTVGKPIRIIGMGYLSTVSGSEETEVDEPRIGYIYALAILGLYRQLASKEVGTASERYQREIARWEREAEIRRRKYRMLLPEPTIKIAG